MPNDIGIRQFGISDQASAIRHSPPQLGDRSDHRAASEPFPAPRPGRREGPSSRDDSSPRPGTRRRSARPGDIPGRERSLTIRTRSQRNSDRTKGQPTLRVLNEEDDRAARRRRFGPRPGAHRAVPDLISVCRGYRGDSTARRGPFGCVGSIRTDRGLAPPPRGAGPSRPRIWVRVGGGGRDVPVRPASAAHGLGSAWSSP